jgi:hypothetical protein
MPTPAKHTIKFGPDAKAEIERRSGLPDLSQVKDEHHETMGTLLKDLRNEFTIDDTEIDDELSIALKKRNDLMHNFFRVRVSDFPNPEKRPAIIGELIATGLLLKKAMITLRGMTVAIEEALTTESGKSEAGPEHPG